MMQLKLKLKLKLKLTGLVAVLLVLTGCATKMEHTDYTAFRAVNPRSILVVPVVSRSVDVDAPDYFLSTITRPLSERGFYVFPVNLVKHVMEDDGMGDASLVHASDTSKLAHLFGADSVLYITIERWDSQYLLISTQTTVELSYSLKSGSTGKELWKKSEKLVYDPNDQTKVQGNPLFSLIATAVMAAVEKARPNYLPLATGANHSAINQLGQGLPAGPYDISYLKDQQQF